MAVTAAEMPESPKSEDGRPVAGEPAAAADPDSTIGPEDVPILFFDGVCGLCNRTVDFVLRNDRRGRLRFAPLQGEAAARLLPARDRCELESVVFWRRGRVRRHSSAVVSMLWEMGGRWRLAAALLWCVPRPLRNLGYRWIAGRRYRWFGRRETCRLPRPEERERLLP